MKILKRRAEVMKCEGRGVNLVHISMTSKHRKFSSKHDTLVSLVWGPKVCQTYINMPQSNQNTRRISHLLAVTKSPAWFPWSHPMLAPHVVTPPWQCSRAPHPADLQNSRPTRCPAPNQRRTPSPPRPTSHQEKLGFHEEF